MAVVVWDGSTDGDFTVGANWSTGSVPTTSDDVVFNSGAVNVDAGLTPSLVTYASFTVTDDYTGTIGTESSFLTINSTLVTIGGGEGAGSRRLNINLGTVLSTVRVTSSNGTGADTNRAPIRFICNATTTDFYISGSTSNVAIIDEPDDTGNIGDINVTGGTVVVGSGITAYTSVYVDGSGTSVTIEEPTAAQTLTQDDGTLTINGANAVAAIVQRGGTCINNTTGTTTAHTLRGGTADYSQSEQARTLTTLTMSPLGTTLKHLEGTLTITNFNRDSNYKKYTISMTES